VFDFMARYAVRLREAFFHPDALDIDRGEVAIRKRKNGLDLAIPLLDDDVRDLAARATRARAAGLTRVWYRETKRGITPIHWRGFQSASKAALDAAGIEGARPAHDLRHHAATSIRREGDVLVVQKLLGHEDLKSSARYAHASSDDVRKALAAVAGKKG
jgi:integrase